MDRCACATSNLCGHRTETTDAPCRNPVAPGSTQCAAGHPLVQSRPLSSAGTVTLPASVSIEELIEPGISGVPNGESVDRVIWSHEEACTHITRYRAAAQKARSVGLEAAGDDPVDLVLLESVSPWLYGPNNILVGLERALTGEADIDDSFVRNLQNVAFLLEPAIAVTLAIWDPEFPGPEVVISIASRTTPGSFSRRD